MFDYPFKLTPGFGRRVGFLAGGILLLILLPSLILSTNRGGVVNSDEILFRKHAIDLGSLSESCAVVDVNRDGRLDIVSSENWYEQGTALAGGKGVHWTKHRFRKVGYNSFYIENLIDIGGRRGRGWIDGYCELVVLVQDRSHGGNIPGGKTRSGTKP